MFVFFKFFMREKSNNMIPNRESGCYYIERASKKGDAAVHVRPLVYLDNSEAFFSLSLNESKIPVTQSLIMQQKTSQRTLVGLTVE